MNRRAVAVLSLAAIGFLMAVVIFYSQVDKLPGNQKYYLGEAEVEIFNTYFEAEKELLYIDIMAGYALNEVEPLSENLLKEFKANFAHRLNDFNEAYGRNLTMDDYEFTLEEDSITGISKREFYMNSENVEYKFKPNFKISLEY